jgi:hypothetical protein
VQKYIDNEAGDYYGGVEDVEGGGQISVDKLVTIADLAFTTDLKPNAHIYKSTQNQSAFNSMQIRGSLGGMGPGEKNVHSKPAQA